MYRSVRLRYVLSSRKNCIFYSFLLGFGAWCLGYLTKEGGPPLDQSSPSPIPPGVGVYHPAPCSSSLVAMKQVNETVKTET